MNTIEATRLARDTIAMILSKEVETMSGCEKHENGWTVTLEVIETKARISDNDLIASYRVDVDKSGDVAGYSRTRRYQRAHSSNVAAA
jgi:hypothetical protein